jgi:hypothetical protein
MYAGEQRVCPGKKLNSKALAASLLIHLAAVPCILHWAIPSRRPAVKQEAVDVEIVRLPEKSVERVTEPGASTEPSEANASDPPHSLNDVSNRPVEPLPVEAAPRQVKPLRMLSESILADDRSRQTREALSQLAEAEQVEQLCNLEAMAQVGASNSSLRPDRVIAYATADTRLNGTSFLAEGAALHSRDDWYRLQFKCDLADDSLKVVAFEFSLGDTIPKRDWQDLSLPDESGPPD